VIEISNDEDDLSESASTVESRDEVADKGDISSQ